MIKICVVKINFFGFKTGIPNILWFVMPSNKSIFTWGPLKGTCQETQRYPYLDSIYTLQVVFISVS